jgi:protein-disulfide isomerase
MRTVIYLVMFLAAITVSQDQQALSSKGGKAGTAHVPEENSPGKETQLPSEETVNAFLREMFGYNPSVSWKVSEIKPSEAQGLAEVMVEVTTPHGLETNQFYVTADGKHAITGDIIPFGSHPFAPARNKLEKEANGFSRGPADAPVTIFEFSDLQCPHCKLGQPIVDKLLSEEKDAKLVFQNFPLTAVHDWAEKAAAYADCIGRTSNPAFWKFIQSVYDSQSDITAAIADDKLKDLADAAGVKGSEMAECAAKPATLGRVERSVELGTSLGVTGTPTLFINGRLIGNLGTIPYEALKQSVEFAAQDAAKAASAAK